MRKHVIVLMLSLAMLSGLAACGGDDGGNGGGNAGGEEAQVREVIALGNSKDAAVCDRLTDKWMENVVGGDKADCEEQVENSPRDAVDIEDVSIDGDRATVTAQIEGDPGRILLAKQDGEWRLDDVQQGE